MGQLKVLKGGEIVFDNGDILSPERVLAFISEPVVLDQNFTLRDYFEMLLKYEQLWLLDEFTEDYIKEFEECPKSGCFGKRDVHKLVLSRLIDITEYEGVKSLDVNFDFSGIGTPPPDAPAGMYKPLEEIGYGIEFCHLNELLDLPLCLGETIITDGNDFDNMQKYPTSFSLHEFFKHIIWELSFLGTPAQRDSERINLHTVMEEVEEAIEKGDKSKFVEVDFDSFMGGSTLKN